MQEPTTEEQVRIVNLTKAKIRPIVKEFLEYLKTRPAETKDDYALVLALLSRFDNKNKQRLVAIVLLEEGYPKDTMSTILRLMGIHP